MKCNIFQYARTIHGENLVHLSKRWTHFLKTWILSDHSKRALLKVEIHQKYKCRLAYKLEFLHSSRLPNTSTWSKSCFDTIWRKSGFVIYKEQKMIVFNFNNNLPNSNLKNQLPGKCLILQDFSISETYWNTESYHYLSNIWKLCSWFHLATFLCWYHFLIYLWLVFPMSYFDLLILGISKPRARSFLVWISFLFAMLTVILCSCRKLNP